MLKKLIIFILFLAITVVAVGVINLNGFGFATDFAMNDSTLDYSKTVKATIIEIPLVEDLMGADLHEVVIGWSKDGEDAQATGYIRVFLGNTEEEEAASAALAKETIPSDADLTTIDGVRLLFWLFFLLMIILLPRKHSKRKIKKLAKIEAENVVDDEMANQRYAAPAPRPRGGSGRRRRDDYDDDYDY